MYQFQNPDGILGICGILDATDINFSFRSLFNAYTCRHETQRLQ